MPIKISAVRTPTDLRAFVALPFRLHANTPWIPPLKLERYVFLTRRLNAFFKHGEAEYFLARREGRVVSSRLEAAFGMLTAPRGGKR